MISSNKTPSMNCLSCILHFASMAYFDARVSVSYGLQVIKYPKNLFDSAGFEAMHDAPHSAK